MFAYYELIPYNYSFLSPEQKYLVHDSFRQLIAQSREGKIHALQIATESSIRSIQEQSKKLVTGKLKEIAYQKIDDQTEALVSMIGDNQVDYRFFLGFKLMVTEDEVNLKNIKKSVFLTFREFLKYFGIPVALTWFMSQKTFDGKKPYSYIKTMVLYALRPKVTYAGKAVNLHKQKFEETITAVRSVTYVPD